jgi:hypothetical protein
MTIKVSSDSRSGHKRTAEQYRIKWLGGQHPTVNRSEWKDDEVERLREIVVLYQSNKTQIDWVAIASELGVKLSFVSFTQRVESSFID